MANWWALAACIMSRLQDCPKRPACGAFMSGPRGDGAELEKHWSPNCYRRREQGSARCGYVLTTPMPHEYTREWDSRRLLRITPATGFLLMALLRPDNCRSADWTNSILVNIEEAEISRS